MGFEMDVSLLLSSALAVAWVKGEALGVELGKPLDAKGCRPLPPLLWRLLMCAFSFKQASAFLCTLWAASSATAMLSAAVSLGLPPTEGDGGEAPGGWLGEDAGRLPFGRRVALLLALVFWRAEKLQSLLQRIQRAHREATAAGVGRAVGNVLTDPWGSGWPGFWGISRRLALLVVSSCGCSSFMLVAFPAVVLDEFLWWASAEAQSWYGQTGRSFHPVADVILQLFDQLHFVPVITRVFFLGVMQYAQLSAVLTVSALAWSAHNCHAFWNAMSSEIPQSLFSGDAADDPGTDAAH